MATEDHDKAEIDHFNLFGKKFSWETDQTGPVGRFTWPPSEAFWEALPKDVPLEWISTYKDAKTLVEAQRALIHLWLGDQGLICLDPDDKVLKEAFVKIALEDALTDHGQKAHEKGSLLLEKAGFKPQVNARDNNLFYIGPYQKEGTDQTIRERLVALPDGNWSVLSTDIVFDKASIVQSITENPEYWSPNVVLRPLYQEAVLPNIVYMGGPAEVAYWLQTKSLFDHFDLPMPTVLPRAFAQINTKSVVQRLQKLNLRFEDVLLDVNQLKGIVMAKLEGSSKISLHNEHQLINQAFLQIKQKAIAADPTLASFVDAQETNVLKTLEGVEKKLSKAIEKRHETIISQTLNLKEKLMPNEGLQERSENILAYAIGSPTIFAELLSLLDPLCFALHILEEE
jgi:bacillithiol biosynthesis cysteine-adding enzyme BshC